GSPVRGSPVRGRPVRGRPVLGPGRRGSAMTARTVPGRPAPDQGQRPGVPLLEVADLQTYYPGRWGLPERLPAGRPASAPASVAGRQGALAADGVIFSLARGELLALVGESGCGKTSTAQTILRMIEPTSGTIRLNGTDITGLSQLQMRPLRRKLQMIYQDPYE